MVENKVLHSLRASYPAVKRIMDISVAAFGLLILSPLLILIACAVKLTSEGPVIFWSQRRGFQGKSFMMPKFRTMTVDSKILSRETASAKDFKLTPIGLFLRKSSLDEIPQLLSVLTGHMSLIGPRPLLVDDQASGERSKTPVIYTVKPGITGLAQVNGRNFIKPSNKARYDAFYARRVCMILDMKILAKTVRTVFDVKLVK